MARLGVLDTGVLSLTLTIGERRDPTRALVASTPLTQLPNQGPIGSTIQSGAGVGVIFRLIEVAWPRVTQLLCHGLFH